MKMFYTGVKEIIEAELKANQRFKDLLFHNSLKNKDKQTPKKPRCAGKLGDLKYGVCPNCGRVIFDDTMCSGCHQLTSWVEV